MAPKRLRVDFNKDWGYIGIEGYTLTDPAFAWVSIKQNRPLKLTLAISQDQEGLWHTYTTSSEDNVQADIVLSGVNPWFNDKHWYEKISGTVMVGAGSGGVVGGIGVGVDISQFTVSVMAFDHSSNVTSPMYGLGLQWRPFYK